MARPITLCFAFITVFLLVQCTVSTDPPEMSPSPSPESGAPVTHPPNQGSQAHSPSPDVGSPPAPPPSDLAPGSSPTPSPVTSGSTPPAPSPTDASDINHSDAKGNKEEANDESSGGLSGKQKAGIAVGVIAAGCLVALAGLIYKKRRDNIQRTQYGYAARREIL